MWTMLNVQSCEELVTCSGANLNISSLKHISKSRTIQIKKICFNEQNIKTNKDCFKQIVRQLQISDDFNNF
jgi:hypothetical protein